MAASQSMNSPAAEADAAYPTVPQYSGSGRPNTRTDRIAFQLWIIMFLLVIMVTLINYLAMQGLFDWIARMFKQIFGSSG